MNDRTPLTSGNHFAGFTIDEFLGSDSTGTRYRAVARGSDTAVHLKILDGGSSDSARREQFRGTNETLRRTGLAGTPRILDFAESGGTPWVTTELITGVRADRFLLQRFPAGMPHQSLCLIADHIARTLDEAAGYGVSHGDVSPANILLSDPFSKNYRIALTDFGHRDATSTPAHSNYAAPEALTGAPAGHSGDQFSLAACTFHLLTGRPAFGADGTRAVTTGGGLHFDSGALDNPAITVDGLEGVFARAFAFDPAGRFDSCTAFVDALVDPARSQATSPKAATPRPAPPRENNVRTTPPAKRSPKKVGRSVVVPATIAITVAVGLTVAAVLIKPARHDAGLPVAAPASPAPIAAAAPAPACQKLDTTLAGLTLRQKLAQTLMVGVSGIDDARAVVDDQQVGGIFVTSWTDLTMLTSGALRDLQVAPRPLPLAVSVDEEGGRVQRLKSILGSQDSPRDLVAGGASTQQVHDIALERGRTMHDLGITIDFAPVVDVTDAADNTVIGDRSFGADPETVITYAGAYAAGLREAGLLPVLKHFPGHGRASGDSHKGGVTTPPLEELLRQDTIPYQTLTTAKPVAVMVGHMQVPDLTGDDPASLSSAAYKLLREGSYGGPPFDGLTFTDDLSSMGAITQRYTVPEAVLRALQAGADVALWISTDQVPAVLDRLESAVANGELTTARVDDAVQRVAMTKDPELSCTR